MKKKLIVLGCIALVFSLCLLSDFIISKTYSYEVISSSPQEGKADGNTVVSIKFRLTKGGKGIKNHNIYAITDKGRIGRRTTDSEGYFIIDYRCYAATSEKNVKDIVITLYDEDNSIFIYVPATYYFTVKMLPPDDFDDGGGTVDDIFFD